VGRATADRALHDAFEEGRRAWPSVDVQLADFRAHVVRHIPPGASLATAISLLCTRDLYLACGATAGDPRAIVACEHYLKDVGGFIAHIDPSPAFAEEVRQSLRVRLFVSEGGAPPKIAAYSGQGPLGGWLRVAAVRLALDLIRARVRGERRQQAGHAEPGKTTGDPEIDFIKQRYRPEFEQAFATALSSLRTDERNVLRLSYLDGLSIDEIAPLYSVHRSTVARWLEGARTQILDETRRLLGERFRLSDQEVDSLMGLFQSDLELSLHTLLESVDER
jgi:RNA polymerase sigma-70 factor (ECF subfamily)